MYMHYSQSAIQRQAGTYIDSLAGIYYCFILDYILGNWSFQEAKNKSAVNAFLMNAATLFARRYS